MDKHVEKKLWNVVFVKDNCKQIIACTTMENFGTIHNREWLVRMIEPAELATFSLIRKKIQYLYLLKFFIDFLHEEKKVNV